MCPQRIVSFLPSATEMVYALGAGDRLVGVTHECDFPPAARSKRVVVRPALQLETMSPGEIDAAVSGEASASRSVYNVDGAALRELGPDLIITQDLCAVCAPAQDDISRGIAGLPRQPRILSLTPHTLEDVLGNVRELGAALGCNGQAEALIHDVRRRLEAIRAQTSGLTPARVFCMEWIDPIYSSGHWVPEMVAIAGGSDEIARKGGDSVRVRWEDIVAFAPEVLVIAPCGFDLAHATQQAAALPRLPGWDAVPAVATGRVFAVDANSYFARPGPRLVDGTKLLAHLIHPEHFEWRGSSDAFAKVG
jgi:iron complex transport system substrate-binding protein